MVWISTIVQRLAGLLFVAALAAPGIAAAAPVTFKFEADIIGVGDLLHPVKTTAEAGHRITGSVTYDTATPYSLKYPTWALYKGAVSHLSVAIEPLGLTWNDAGAGPIEIYDNRYDGRDRFWIRNMPLDGSSLGAPGIEMRPIFFELVLVDSHGDAFDSVELPEHFELSPFLSTAAVVLLSFSGTVPDPNEPSGYRIVQQPISASITSLEFVSVSVPEPATLAMLGIGLAGLGLARRKRAA